MSTADARHHARLRQLLEAADLLGDDELTVLIAIARRVAAGQSDYGALDLNTDRRDFTREAAEEVLDSLFYCAATLVPRSRRRRNRV